MIPLFAATLFLSATLLFLVQPMVGKWVLPALGGTPAVWNTCLVFFQATLLAGYAWAHASVGRLGVRRQTVVQVAIVVAPLVLLPFAFATEIPPPGGRPVLWLLGRLLLTVGPPVFVVATIAPLLQRWFVETGHPASDDPYFLYAASNAGSLLALLTYPLILERAIDLTRQSLVWAAGYGTLVVAVATCALVVRRASRGAPPRSDTAASPPATRSERLRWLALSAVPSSALLGVTAHVTTNIAAVPLLWVLPLALYLLTFVLAFARGAGSIRRAAEATFPLAVVVFAPLLLFDTREMTWLSVALNLLLFFVVAMACHGELARRRPDGSRLTEFYLWVSIGGVVGGAINAIVSPLVFDSLVEYPLVIVAACFLVGGRGRRFRPTDLRLPVGMALVGLALWLALPWRDSWLWTTTAVAVASVLCFVASGRALRFGLAAAVYLGTIAAFTVPSERVLLSERNFFGVKRVVEDAGGRFRTLVHGTTNHGMQFVDPALRRRPTSYYHPAGPIGDVFGARERRSPSDRIAIVGLGVGGLAPYARPGEAWRFYEIDPAVERIAENPSYFTYLADCRARYDVVLGDGRLSLAREPAGSFDLIVLDAFSSDAVPTHLLTVEAVSLYLEKLAPDGMLVFNVTNAYLDLAPLMGNLAADRDLVAVRRFDPAQETEPGRMPSHYVAMARTREALAGLGARPGWSGLSADPGAPLWTDRFSDVLRLFRRPRLPETTGTGGRSPGVAG